MPSYVLPDGVDSTAADRAALRIQCAQRCRQARKKTGTLRKSRSDEFIKQCEEDLKVTAAITLQAAARKSHAKTVVAEKRVQAAAPVELKYLNIQPSFATTTGSTPTPKTAGDLFYTMASASAFGTSLNRAFALASVASFAQISREDPETRKALQYFMMADFQPTLLHECAAVVIQCQYRVRLARRVVAKLRAMRKEKLESMHDEQLTLVAVQDIQRAVRGHLDRKLVTTQIRPVPIRPRTAPTPDAAAMRIQCAQRQRQARKEVQRRRVIRQTALEEMHSAQLVEHSTIEIQRHYRGFQHRQQKTGAPAVAPVVRGGSGRGLNALFFAAGGALLDSTGPQRCLFWGVRILHAVTMDVIIHAKQTDRMPELEFSRWVQGPLGSIIPLSRSAAVERPRSGRLPALEGRPTPRAANDDNGTSTEGSPSARKKLAPLVEKSSPP